MVPLSIPDSSALVIFLLSSGIFLVQLYEQYRKKKTLLSPKVGDPSTLNGKDS